MRDVKRRLIQTHLDGILGGGSESGVIPQVILEANQAACGTISFSEVLEENRDTRREKEKGRSGFVDALDVGVQGLLAQAVGVEVVLVLVHLLECL